MKLFEHQREGLKFLASCYNNRHGAILAFDMGLGKTINYLAWHKLLMKKKLIKHSLIIVPVSLLESWKQEVESYLRIEPNIYWGKNKQFINSPIQLTTYSMIGRDDFYFEFMPFLKDFSLCMDEGHEYLQKTTSQRWQYCQTLSSGKTFKLPKHTVVLSGTPISNKPEDAFGVVKIVHSSLAGSEAAWLLRYCRTKTIHIKGKYTKGKKRGSDFQLRQSKIIGYRNLRHFHNWISPVILRKTKEECLDLPPKTIIETPYPKPDGYDQLLRFHKNEQSSASTTVEEAIKLLSGRSGKLKNCVKYELLVSKLNQTITPSIVWVSRRESCALLYQNLKKQGFKVFQHHGGLTKNQREDEIRRFKKQREQAVLVATIQSAGVGYNLQNASNAFFYEMVYKYSSIVQAMDRIYRIGQIRPVFIYMMYGVGTIEEAIYKLVCKKEKINNALIHGNIDLQLEGETFMLDFM